MATFHFELVSPDKLLFNGRRNRCSCRATKGDFVVLSDHAPVMTSVRPGVVAIDDAAGQASPRLRARRLRRRKHDGPDPARRDRHPVEHLDADKLGQEIKNAEEDLADASEDEKRLAQEKLDRLRELKDAMKL